MAIQHNHNLLAAQTTIQQSQAEEITANLRPNPVLLAYENLYASKTSLYSSRKFFWLGGSLLIFIPRKIVQRTDAIILTQ